jgi:hypothetical protein
LPDFDGSKQVAGAAGGVFESSNLALYTYGRNSPIVLKDPDGNIVPILLAAWAVYEVASSAYDIYTAAKTLSDPNATTTEKGIAVGGAMLSVVAPGGGYGTGGKALAREVAETAGQKVAKEGGEAAAKALKQFDVVPYGTVAKGFEKHHGVLDVWAKENVAGYVSRSASSPAMLLTKEQHDITKQVFRDWLKEKTGKPVGGAIDWKSVSPREMQTLTEKMLQKAGVPEQAARDYYRAFHKHIYGD